MSLDKATVKSLSERATNEVDPAKKIDLLAELIKGEMLLDEENIKIKEKAIYDLCNIYSEQKKPESLAELAKTLRPFLDNLPKAKTAKLVKHIIEEVGRIAPNDTKILDTQIDVCKDSIEWANNENRSFLRQRLQTRLSELYFKKKDYISALELITKVLYEVRKLDDKGLLVEILLLESRIHFQMKDNSKSKAALVAARTNATSIYCPPKLQAELDQQSGIVHAEDHDYKTAFSYFYEAFEGFSSLGQASAAVLDLKYMLMCKIISGAPEDVAGILTTKTALQYASSQNTQVEAMRRLTAAYSEKSLHKFESTLKEYSKELTEDEIMKTHLTALYESLLEQHLLKIIEPFSRVQISHIAKLMGLAKARIEQKLSQMILDGVLNGFLDQKEDCLNVVEAQKEDEVYPSALETVRYLNDVVDSLFARANELKK